jgi:MOSC domain-containing protein YiiM
VLIELHSIGNVVCLRLNEAVGLIIERRQCFRGARWKRQSGLMSKVLRKGKSRRSDTYKQYRQNDPDFHWLSHFWPGGDLKMRKH